MIAEIENPPAEFFSFSVVATMDDVDQMKAFDAEVLRLVNLAEDRNPRTLTAAHERAAEVHQSQQSEQTFEELKDTDNPRKLPRELLFAKHREYKFLRQKAVGLAWQYFRSDVLPFMLALFNRAIALGENEIAAQQIREAELTADFARWKAWATYYHAPFMMLDRFVPSKKLADNLSVLKMRRDTLGEVPTGVQEPPSCAEKCAALGLQFAAPRSLS